VADEEEVLRAHESARSAAKCSEICSDDLGCGFSGFEMFPQIFSQLKSNWFQRFMCLTIVFFFQAEDGIRDFHVTGVQTCALPIYGGVDGLVTIEDLIEQVLGDIEDEHDIGEDDLWTEEKPGCYIALAKTPLEEFEAEIGQSLTDVDIVDEEEIDTLGGLVFMLSGRVPVRGEVVEHPNGTVFEVVEADPRRIKRLRVRVANAGKHA